LSHLASTTVTAASGLAADILVDEEGPRHRRWIGEPGGLDEDGSNLPFFRISRAARVR
jgi:hypothetical protein